MPLELNSTALVQDDQVKEGREWIRPALEKRRPLFSHLYPFSLHLGFI